MKRNLLLLACTGALCLTACTGDSSFPNPTGRGTVRAINAIPESPDVRFLIEERSLGVAGYQEATATARFDDFEYNFNFDISLPDDTQATRIATTVHKVEANRDHVFLVTGDALSPTVTIISADAREFPDGASFFEIRFVHVIESLNAADVDIYLDELVDPPVVVNKVATLSYGEVSTVQDVEQGEYVVTITAAGDPNTVHYSSVSSLYVAAQTQFAVAFDGDANDTGPILVSVSSDAGIQRRLPDAGFPSTVRFVNGSLSLDAVDIFDDEMLTSRIVTNLAHGAASGDIVVSGDTETYRWTPTGSTATVLVESGYTPPLGTHSHIAVVGAIDEWTALPYLSDRAPVSLYAKLTVLQTAVDNDLLDVYLLPADETIDEDDVPVLRALFTPDLTAPLPVKAGSYDLYATALGERTPIAGPLRIDAANGDIFDVMILDTADPAVAALTLLPAP